MNKKAIAITIGILAILIIVLTVWICFYVLAREKNVSAEINTARIMDEVYIKNLLLDYYLKNAFENAAESADPFSKDVFIERFLKELENYKSNGEYLIEGFDEVEDEIEDSIEFNGVEKKLVLNIDVKVREVSDGIAVSYNYKKKFEKEFE